mmetsp:Transcript_104708/g.186279  ORF Transcript_104708/g.186279 Transcript_104708/m.186279 type:complete len:208 (-) Transcript_104708:15-638(-)
MLLCHMCLTVNFLGRTCHILWLALFTSSHHRCCVLCHNGVLRVTDCVVGHSHLRNVAHDCLCGHLRHGSGTSRSCVGCRCRGRKDRDAFCCRGSVSWDLRSVGIDIGRSWCSVSCCWGYLHGIRSRWHGIGGFRHGISRSWGCICRCRSSVCGCRDSCWLHVRCRWHHCCSKLFPGDDTVAIRIDLVEQCHIQRTVQTPEHCSRSPP